MDKKKPLNEAEARKISRMIEIREKYSGDSATDQRSRLLVALKEFTVTTLDARRYLDILHPGGRIMELRKRGWPVEMVWTREPTECGKLHRVGLYLLRRVAA